jgi:hypothetical protein
MLRRTLIVTLVSGATLALPLPGAAQRNPLPDPDAGRAALEQAQREREQRTAQEQERRIQRARENCIANRGVDCETPEGLTEWVLLERSRAEAVLDRIAPPSGSASTGSSAPPR